MTRLTGSEVVIHVTSDYVWLCLDVLAMCTRFQLTMDCMVVFPSLAFSSLLRFFPPLPHPTPTGSYSGDRTKEMSVCGRKMAAKWSSLFQYHARPRATDIAHSDISCKNHQKTRSRAAGWRTPFLQVTPALVWKIVSWGEFTAGNVIDQIVDHTFSYEV
jgi:hypothetical protein